ncbi:unnamed protein product, partial [Hapterophycus canaliculatus]
HARARRVRCFLSILVGPTFQAVRLSYMHFLKTVLTRPLREDGVDGAAACVELLEEYGLSRDDLFEVRSS